MRIQLIDPQLGKDDAKIVPVLEAHGLDSFVPAGAVIDVPDEVAGVGPHWREARPGDDLAFMERGPNGGVRDLGHGLLAQVGIWAKADDNTSDSEEIAFTEGQAR